MKSLIKNTLLFLAILSAAHAATSPSGTHLHVRPDAHAPISIMSDHTHKKGEWMLSYRFMQMNMDGMRSGTNRVSSAEVLAADYTVIPEQMTMDMHMFGLMYAPTNDLTLMVMGNYQEIEMSHKLLGLPPLIAANGGSDTFTTKSSGFGDLKIGGLYNLYQNERRKLHAGLSLSLPTGSIDETDNTPKPGMPPSFLNQQLPAPMQLGSGTFDLLPSITYVSQFERWSYGAQANAIIRLEDENDNAYRLGHVFETISWASVNTTNWMSLSGGFAYRYTGELEGQQQNVGTTGPMMRRSVTTAFGENHGGEHVDGILGINFLITGGFFEGHRIAIDARLPLWQDLNGYQLELDSSITIGWQLAF